MISCYLLFLHLVTVLCTLCDRRYRSGLLCYDTFFFSLLDHGRCSRSATPVDNIEIYSLPFLFYPLRYLDSLLKSPREIHARVLSVAKSGPREGGEEEKNIKSKSGHVGERGGLFVKGFDRRKKPLLAPSMLRPVLAAVPPSRDFGLAQLTELTPHQHHQSYENCRTATG